MLLRELLLLSARSRREDQEEKVKRRKERVDRPKQVRGERRRKRRRRRGGKEATKQESSTRATFCLHNGARRGRGEKRTERQGREKTWTKEAANEQSRRLYQKWDGVESTTGCQYAGLVQEAAGEGSQRREGRKERKGRRHTGFSSSASSRQRALLPLVQRVWRQ